MIGGYSFAAVLVLGLRYGLVKYYRFEEPDTRQWVCDITNAIEVSIVIAIGWHLSITAPFYVMCRNVLTFPVGLLMLWSCIKAFCH